MRKRYAVVGTGWRARGFIEAIARDYQAEAQLAAFCDLSPTRMAWYNEYLRSKFGTPETPAYPASDFRRMLGEIKPDVVLVATTDATHHQYAIAAMEAGCDVICEKPLTTAAANAQAICDKVEQTGRRLTVTFNMRYMAEMNVVKRLLNDGVIGRPRFVDLQWVLDTSHGADYFRRWHATKSHSGGLIVHKSTHHFDIVNWWLDDWPQTVFAAGDLYFYGQANAEARGERYAYDRYTTDVPEAQHDPFALRLDGNREWYRRLYLEAERDSGYLRDRNVFGEHVDIEDAVSATVRYRGGAILNYSLVAFSPWEGFRASITGTRGRIELVQRNAPHVHRNGEGVSVKPAAAPVTTCTVYPMFRDAYQVEIPKLEGGHGGADPLLFRQLFAAEPPADDLGRAATHLDGVASALLGIAANESMRSGQAVACDELVRLPLRTFAHSQSVVSTAQT